MLDSNCFRYKPFPINAVFEFLEKKISETIFILLFFQKNSPFLLNDPCIYIMCVLVHRFSQNMIRHRSNFLQNPFTIKRFVLRKANCKPMQLRNLCMETQQIRLYTESVNRYVHVIKNNLTIFQSIYLHQKSNQTYFDSQRGKKKPLSEVF